MLWLISTSCGTLMVILLQVLLGHLNLLMILVMMMILMSLELFLIMRSQLPSITTHIIIIRIHS